VRFGTHAKAVSYQNLSALQLQQRQEMVFLTALYFSIRLKHEKIQLWGEICNAGKKGFLEHFLEGQIESSFRIKEACISCKSGSASLSAVTHCET